MITTQFLCDGMQGLWVTWEKQRRNKGLSEALGWPLHEIIHPDPRLRRYIYSIAKTVSLLLQKKTSVVAAQNPSIILAFIVIVLKYILKYKAVIDAHNSGIYPMEGMSAFMMMVSRWIQRHADLTIVTNAQLKAFVEYNGGRAFVLPDRLPEVPLTLTSPAREGRVNIAFICTYSLDEPFKEVFHAARLLPEDFWIYVTGRYKGKVDECTIPMNVKLLGFVPEDQFWGLLSSVDFILDLTLREGCLVCGAYEGVALGKPLILSDTKTLKSYFNKGCVYVAPNASSIASGMIEAMEHRDRLLKEIKHLQKAIIQNWDETFTMFRNFLCSLMDCQ